MDELDDFGLIDRACGGSSRAFEILVRRHYDAMYKMAYRWCGNRADAQDVTQSACVKLARALDGFEKKSAFTSWLYRLVVNTAKDWQRQHARHRSDTLDEHTAIKAPGADVDGAVYAKQVLEEVRKLPAAEKEALLLVACEGLSHREAAEVMECAESTVSWRIHEARKKLNAVFESERGHG